MTRRPYLALFAVLAPLSLCLACDARADAPPAPAHKSINDGSRGARIYMQSCASCHQADGSGVPNLQPSLIGDPVIGEESPKTLIEVILKGPAAVLPPNRPHYGNLMTPFDSLSDREVASLVTFLRKAFGKPGAAVKAADVAAERGS